MKSLNRVMAPVAAISFIVFITALIMLVASDGGHEMAGKLCFFSVSTSFLSLVVYNPDYSKDSLEGG